MDNDAIKDRLRTEALKDYDVRFPNPRFDAAVRTLNFFIGTYAHRANNMDKVEVPLSFLQQLCTLAVDGFEAASGYTYEHEKDALSSLLDKIWLNFTWTLLWWVEKQREHGSIPEELWYSCFKVPTWFIQFVEERMRERRVLTQSL